MPSELPRRIQSSAEYEDFYEFNDVINLLLDDYEGLPEYLEQQKA
jgi:hypothetical protein